MHTQTDPHPFRDGSAGTEAKRRKLLIDRRDELATMNHEIRRVYVTRFSGLSAALALSLGGALLVLASSISGLSATIGDHMPGGSPAPLSTILLGTWLVAALAYLGGRALAEHRFNVAMSRAVLPTSDLHVDVARLANESPNAVGCRLAQHLETPARFLSLLAAGCVVPATLLVALLAMEAGNYPPVDLVESYLGTESAVFAALAILALSNGLAIATRPKLGGLSLLALNSLACGLVAFWSPAALFYLVPAALVLSVIAIRSQRLHRRQNARIEQSGEPIAPVFALRKRLRRVAARIAAMPSLCTRANGRLALAKVRSSLQAARRFRPSAVHLASFAMLIVGAVAIAFAICPAQSAQASGQAPSHTVVIDNTQPVQPSRGYASPVIDHRDGLVVDLNFANGFDLDASYLLAGASIPSGWRATVTVTRLSGDGAFFVNAFDNDRQPPRLVNDTSPNVVFEEVNCGAFAEPLALHAQPYGSWADLAGSATLQYQVRMDLVGSCQDES